jgi:hypothetical protein
MKVLVFITSLFISFQGLNQLFTESIGSVGGTTSIAAHESVNGFDNDGYTMSGTGDIRNTGVSAGYAGASANANVFLTNNGTASFQIAGIVTTGCSSLSLSFGAFKNTTASNMTELVFEYSTDGVNYTTVPIPAQPTGTGTAIWRLITINLPVGAENQSNLRLRWRNSSTTPQFRVDDIMLTGSCSIPNTISISNLSTSLFSTTCTSGSPGSIDLSTTGTFNAGNTFTAQLSNASGSFASPVNLTTSLSMSGTNPAGTINFTIPAAMPSGTAYRIRIVSSDPFITSPNNGSDLTINLTETCSPPHITSVIINSCNSVCQEGDNELFFGNTGDFSIEFTADNLDIYYGSSLSPTTNYTQSVHDNPSATADFNTNAGCPGLFLDAYTTTIPANASFMIANVDVCPLDVIDFTNLCGSGPIYVIYVDATSWSSGGNFANSPSCGSGGFRYFQSSITTMLNSNHTIDFYYECALNTGLDGDYAVWNENGGAAQLHGNNGCAFPPVVLPSEMISFYALRNGKQTAIFWKTASELNNDFFTISHSSDGKNFLPLGTVKGAGNLNELMNYQFTHERPSRGINYYKLSSTDYDGTTYNKGIASVLVDADGTYFDPFTAQLKFGEKSDYTVYSSDGKKLGEVWNQESMDFQQSGFIIVQNRRKGTIERLFIP